MTIYQRGSEAVPVVLTLWTGYLGAPVGMSFMLTDDERIEV